MPRLANKPKRANGRAAQQRILRAATAMLAERDFSKLTLREIADTAEVSLSSLYLRYPTKRALIHHLFDEYVEAEKSSAFISRYSANDEWLQGTLSDVVSTGVHGYVRHLRLFRPRALAFRRACQDDETLAAKQSRHLAYQYQLVIGKGRMALAHFFQNLDSKQRDELALRTVRMVIALARDMMDTNEGLLPQSQPDDLVLADRVVQFAVEQLTRTPGYAHH